MDCPSDENLIRLKLDGAAEIACLSFDLLGPRVIVTHDSSAQSVLQRLAALDLGATLLESKRLAEPRSSAAGDTGDAAERRMLKQVLVINAAMCVLELAVGVFAQSTGLIADSLDIAGAAPEP